MRHFAKFTIAFFRFLNAALLLGILGICFHLDRKISRIFPLSREKKIPAKPDKTFHYFYPNAETRHYQEFFNYFQRPEFKKEYENFAKNLDRNSADIVNQLVDRICFCCTNSQGSANFFTDNEIADILKNNQRLQENVLKIDENHYNYGPYSLPVNHFSAIAFHYHYGITSFQSLREIQRKDIIEMGTHTGASALILANYTRGTVWAFEPRPDHYRLLEKTLALNDVKNICPQALALGKSETLYNVCLCQNGKNYSLVNNYCTEGIENAVPITTIDHFVQSHQLQIGLIKLDIHGYLQDCLEGAKQTIQSQKPALIIGIYHCPNDFLHVKTLLESWNADYKFRILKPNDGNILLKTMLLAECDSQECKNPPILRENALEN